jgi:hypothetical protein
MGFGVLKTGFDALEIGFEASHSRRDLRRVKADGV